MWAHGLSTDFSYSNCGHRMGAQDVGTGWGGGGGGGGGLLIAWEREHPALN